MGIDASHAVDIAIWEDACEVTRTVDTPDFRMLHKLFCGQLWAVSVPKRKPWTRDTELARITKLHGF